MIIQKAVVNQQLYFFMIMWQRHLTGNIIKSDKIYNISSYENGKEKLLQVSS